MTPKWAHLPNAVHIDRVVASALANPAQWVTAWDVAPDGAWMSARETARESARYKLRDQGRDAAWYFARDAVLALIAYDDCAYMLESDPGELAILAKFGDPRAILLLPACKVFHVPKDPV